MACKHDLLHSLTFFILKISMSRRVAIGCHDSFKQRVDSASVVLAAGSSCVTEFESAFTNSGKYRPNTMDIFSNIQEYLVKYK